MNKTIIKDSGYETMKHRCMVQKYMTMMMKELLDRANNHDQSKMENPEKPLFDEYTPKLAGMTYGSEEYQACLKAIKPALDHHYANNCHHPEHYKNGVDDMDLVDLMEMIADWKAATKRHNDGNILKSLEKNKERFHISDQLNNILMNTVERYFKE